MKPLRRRRREVQCPRDERRACGSVHVARRQRLGGRRTLHSESRDQAPTRAVGAFPDRASALHPIAAVAMQATSIWRDRIYLDMSLLDDRSAAAA